MAEESAAAKETSSEAKSGGKPLVLYALVILNMVVVAGVGVMLYLGKQKESAHARDIEKAARGELEAQKEESASQGADFVGKMIPMETFLVNLSGNRGNKLLKVSMELEVENDKVAEEIDKRKPQVRDIIIILLSSKTFAQLSATEGKEFLREEIRDTVNSFLTQGKIKRVLFTEFIFN